MAFDLLAFQIQKSKKIIESFHLFIYLHFASRFWLRLASFCVRFSLVHNIYISRWIRLVFADTVSYRHHFKQHKKPPQLPPSSSSISPLPSHQLLHNNSNNSSTNNTINDGHSQTDAQDKTDINNRVEYGGVHAIQAQTQPQSHMLYLFNLLFYYARLGKALHICVFSLSSIFIPF